MSPQKEGNAAQGAARRLAGFSPEADAHRWCVGIAALGLPQLG